MAEPVQRYPAGDEPAGQRHEHYDLMAALQAPGEVSKLVMTTPVIMGK